MTARAPRPAPGPATLDDLLAIAEERRFHELIDGNLVEKEAASGKHGEAQTRLGRKLGPFDWRHGGPPDRPGGWRFASEVEIYFDATNTFRPDCAGWRRERLPEMPAEVPVRVVPDWVCEILSTNRANDLVRKKRVYHLHRVGHYWILDPVAETLLVYRWGPDGYIEVLAAQRGERVRAEPFVALEIDIGVLLGDDEE
ncbi:MAG: Uma2 family endonuclease [Polyangiaceae bacterium]